MSNPGAKSTRGAGVVFLEKRGVRHFIAARDNWGLGCRGGILREERCS